MDHNRLPHEYLQQQAAEQGISPAGTILYGLVVIYALHQLFVYFDYPILSPQELLWNAIVYAIPKRLLLDGARRQELKANGMLSQTHAAKSEALRRMLGMGGNAVMQSMPAGGIMRRASTNIFSKPQITSDAPPGLGNWDNSCYQNSVLQGLASLDSLKPFLERTTGEEEVEGSMSSSLLETVGKLKGADNNGKQLWTPAKLKSMSSWQQQDAQEYFSKIMDELDKEAAKARKASASRPGLESISEEGSSDAKGEEIAQDQAQRNPMEGLLAQKVACTRCGFSEGLSLIPFNCLTVPLGSDFAYDLDECLDEYTKLEEITDVECAKCTLLRAEKQLTAMLPQAPTTNGQTGEEDEEEGKVDSKVLALPPELRAQAFKRLAAIQTALEEDDFDDKTIAEKCEIGKKARVSSTKTRQAVVARAPRSLVVHVNRSVFDEMTGVQRKNYASVRWPGELDLGSWMLKSGEKEGFGGGPSLLSPDGEGSGKARYRIKAVVTHYGRHENGHYICYRRHPVHLREEAIAEEDGEASEEPQPQKQSEEKWWRLSDEDVSSVSEDEVLAQGGVFMLFYERINESKCPVERARTEVGTPDAVGELLRGEARNGPGKSERFRALKLDDDPADTSAIEPESETSATASASPPKTDESVGSSAVTTPAMKTHAASEAEPEMPSLDEEAAHPAQKPRTPPPMRTARGRQSSKSEKGFSGMGMRAVAAT